MEITCTFEKYFSMPKIKLKVHGLSYDLTLCLVNNITKGKYQILHSFSLLLRSGQLKTENTEDIVLIIQAKGCVCFQNLCCISSTELCVPPDTLLVSSICVCNYKCVTFHCFPLRYLFPCLLPAVLSDIPRYIFGPVSNLSIRKNIAVCFSKN